MARKRTAHEVDDATIDDNAQSPEIAAFAKTLNRLLIEKHVHQDDLAEAIGISTGSISAYRNGKKEPRFTMIVKIADYLGVDCHYLLTGVRAKNAAFRREGGLSDKAAEILKANKGTPALSPVLESKHFWRMLDYIRKSAHYADRRGEMISMAITQILKGDKDALPAEDMDDFFKFAAVNAAGELFNEASARLYNEMGGNRNGTKDNT